MARGPLTRFRAYLDDAGKTLDMSRDHPWDENYRIGRKGGLISLPGRVSRWNLFDEHAAITKTGWIRTRRFGYWSWLIVGLR